MINCLGDRVAAMPQLRDYEAESERAHRENKRISTWRTLLIKNSPAMAQSLPEAPKSFAVSPLLPALPPLSHFMWPCSSS
jgi:hypothetical protein